MTLIISDVRLREIQMSEYDAEMYESFSSRVRRQVQSLRVILDSLQARGKERVWLRNQTSGELDDGKLIEGLTGERAIYKKRGEEDPEVFFLCYGRSCDSPKGTVSFKTRLILIARVLIFKKRQRINFLKMSCDWRIRRIIPIALKCYIHVIYAVADPAEGTGGPALLIFRPN